MIFIEISVRSQGSPASANPTIAYRNDTIQLSIGEKKINHNAPFRVFIIFILSPPLQFSTIEISYLEHTVNPPFCKANPTAKSFPVHEIKKFVRNKPSLYQITYTSQKSHLLQNPRQSFSNLFPIFFQHKKAAGILSHSHFPLPYTQPSTAAESTSADCFTS